MKLELRHNLAYALLLAALATSCSKKDDSDSDATTTTEEEQKEKEAKDAVSGAESVAELNISGSLNISLPDAINQREESGLQLTAGARKSAEACMIGQTVSEVTDEISNAASFFCHLEVEADKIKFGTKYSIESNGEEFGRIWADNSNSANGQITLYMCQKDEGVMKLREKIDITGVTENGAKGSMQFVFHEGAHSGKSSITFDANVTEDGVVTLSSEQAFEDSEQDGSFRRAVTLKLVEDGVSEIVLASNGNWQGSDFAQKAVGRFNGEVGTTLFTNTGTYIDQTFEWTHASFFDAEGKNLVDPEMYDVFAEDGELYVSADELPEFLAEDFSPDAPDGWDCEVEETIELDPESAEHQKCNKEHNQFKDCHGEGFEQGEAAE
ncbi:MAG: hypothetical protein AB7T49_07215 [Oligoflexales bacterium]